MRLTDRIRIQTLPEAIWVYVGNPERWVGFHPRVARVQRRSGSGPAVDSHYDVDFEMKGRRLVHRGRIAGLEPLRRLHFTATCPGLPEGGPQGLEVDLVYELRPGPHDVEVRESFEIHGHGLPRYVALLAGLVNRFGRPAEPSGLQQLKSMLEQARPLRMLG